MRLIMGWTVGNSKSVRRVARFSATVKPKGKSTQHRVVGLFNNDKTARAWHLLSTPSSIKVKENLKFYLYDLLVPSWPAWGITFLSRYLPCWQSTWCVWVMQWLSWSHPLCHGSQLSNALVVMVTRACSLKRAWWGQRNNVHNTSKMLPSTQLNFEHKMQRNTHQMTALVTCLSAANCAQTCISRSPLYLNHLTPNGHYMGHTAQLTSRCCILYIYSTNIRTEYFKCAA